MKPLPPFDVESIQSFIIQRIIDRKVMAPYLASIGLQSRGFYPAVIGGVNVVRCASISQRAKKLIGTLYSNDIDIKYIISHKVKDLSDRHVQAAHKERSAFLQHMTTDTKLQKILQEAAHFAGYPGLTITLELKDSTDSQWEGIRKNMRIALQAVYSWKENTKKYAKDLIDTGVYSDYSQEMFFNYMTYIDAKLKQPVPTHTYKEVPFATCSWTYFDTVRMLILYGERYHRALAANDDKEIEFQFQKYLKYLAKFAVLYVQINKLKDNDHTYRLIKQLYVKTQSVISAINIQRETQDSPRIMTPHRDFMRSLLQELKGHTNITKLETAFKKGLRGTTRTLRNKTETQKKKGE